MKPISALSTLIFIMINACSGPALYSETIPISTPILINKPSTQSITATTIPQPPIPTATPTSGSSPSTTPVVKIELVDFTTQDGIRLAGTLFGEGDPAVILAHMGNPGVDQESWQPFARLLAERGFTTLTFDFRGRGKSEGKLDFNQLPYDLYAAIQFLNERGYDRIVCIGASMGGTACMRAALDRELIGLGVIASLMNMGEQNQVSADELQQLTLPKVMVYSLYDLPRVVIDMEIIAKLAPEPKLIQAYQTSVHATDLFNTEYGDQFRELLISFLYSLQDTIPLPVP